MDELDPVGPDSLPRFVERWYGPPDLPPPAPLPPVLPAALRQWYRLALRRSIPLSRGYTFRSVDEVIREVDEFVPLWCGPHQTWGYGADGDPDDPPVFERDTGVEPETADSDGEWLPTGLTLSRFLVYVAVFEAIHVPIHGLVHLGLPDEVTTVLLRRMRRLEDPLWTWPEATAPDSAMRFYADDDLLACAGDERLVVAARHRDALGRFDGYALDWDWDSRRENQTYAADR